MRMTTAATSAAQSSASGIFVHRATVMPIAAAAEVMASERWCQASARTAPLCTSEPTASTDRKRVSLTTTTPSSTSRVNGSGRWCGVRISRIDSIVITTEATISMSPTAAAAIGSALP